LILAVTPCYSSRSLSPLSDSPILLQRLQYGIQRRIPVHLPTSRNLLANLAVCRPRLLRSSCLRRARRRSEDILVLRYPSKISLLNRLGRTPSLRHKPTKRLSRSRLKGRNRGTRLIRPERRSNPNWTRLPRSTRRIAERTRTLPRRKRWTLSPRSGSGNRTGPRRASLRKRSRPDTLTRRRSPLLGRSKPRLRNRICPLASSLIGRNPFRDWKWSLRCLRRLRNLTNRTAEAWRFRPGFLVNRAWPRKDRSHIRPPLASLIWFRLPLGWKTHPRWLRRNPVHRSTTLSTSRR